jgi:hypothetical protein
MAFKRGFQADKREASTSEEMRHGERPKLWGATDTFMERIKDVVPKLC